MNWNHRTAAPVDDLPAHRPRRARRAGALLAAAALVAGAGIVPAGAAEHGPEMIVDPDVAGIGQTFTVSNALADCSTEVSVTVGGPGQGLDLWAPIVLPDGAGNWAEEFTVPTADVLAGTYEVNATCVVTLGEPGETFDYATAYLTVPPFSEGFIDVSTGHQFYVQIMWMANAGIANGYADGTFRPDHPITRQAMAAFLYRMAGEPYGPDPGCTADQFPDVPIGHEFCGEIGWMVVEGITTGYDDFTFRPTDTVTRQATSAFLYRYSGSPLGDDPICYVDQFADVPVGHAFCGEIAWMVDEGSASGYADGTFRPAIPVSRQAAAAFLYYL